MIICHGCKRLFQPDPRFRLQVFCSPCRTPDCLVGSAGSPLKKLQMKDDLIVKPGFISKLMDKGESYGEFVKRIKIDIKDATARIWDSTGRVPSRDGGVIKLCRALKMSKTELEQRFGR